MSVVERYLHFASLAICDVASLSLRTAYHVRNHLMLHRPFEPKVDNQLSLMDLLILTVLDAHLYQDSPCVHQRHTLG
jgi:hypothetical protein